ncbi:MAG: 4-amino-4-deoxy-L-arabinose transferase-like glycosyltransferase [Planctomycetota bacterium]
MTRRALPFALTVLTFVLLFLHTAWEKSPTWDEVGYIGLGAYLLKTGQWDVPAAGSHPPLAFYINSPPSFLYPLDWNFWQYPGIERDVRFLRSADTIRGNAHLLDPRYDGEQFFFYTRATSLLFAFALFWVLIRWSNQLYSFPRSLLPPFLCALSPNILAHAPLINTDFALTATFVGAVFAVRSLLYTPSLLTLSIAGIALGLALLSKLSALVLLPIIALLFAWFVLCADTTQRNALGSIFIGLSRNIYVHLAALYTAICALAALVLWVGYGFQITPYLQTVQSQLWDIGTGHWAYLMGEFSTSGWWYYFPITLLIKTPLPTLLFTALGAYTLVAQRQRRLEAGFLLLPPLLLVAGFIVGNSKNIGLRYLLPIYPFLFLLCGYAALSLRRNIRAVIAGGLCLWYAIGAAYTHPHHLAYFNELVGGSSQGYRYLADSNLDWGQDLKGLKHYMDKHGIEKVKLSYFGTVDPRLYNLDYEWLPSFMLANPQPDTPVTIPTDGIIAISATNLVGVYMDQYGHGKDIFSWLRDQQPIAHIGHSILIYKIAPP